MAQSGKNPRGNKKYYHVLIDINRGELFDKYIREQLKVKPTSWIRDIVYKFLQDNIDEKEYNEALKKDEEKLEKSYSESTTRQGIIKTSQLNQQKIEPKIVTDGTYNYKIINGVRHWLSTPPDTYEK